LKLKRVFKNLSLLVIALKPKRPKLKNLKEIPHLIYESTYQPRVNPRTGKEN